ncbi:MBL fold metallo-hydrolase [Texcoconibacillus texcoconensis]|nr:MBL fold metallo-hydrolase [Texcoconibacillus texcoconensis]
MVGKLKVIGCCLTLPIISSLGACTGDGDAQSEEVETGEAHFTFLDVEQGDSTLIQDEDTTIMVDTGRHDNDVIFDHIENYDVENIDLLILTHPHADHIGNADEIIAQLDVEEVWMSGDEHTTQTYERVIDATINSDSSYEEPRRGETYGVGAFTIEMLHPESLTGDLHEGSLSFHIYYDDFNVLFTGDAEKESEIEMLEAGLDLQADVFQLGHHGSSTSNTKTFLEAVEPSVGIYSAAEDNRYGHPHDEVVERFADMDIELYGTDENGTIQVVANDGDYTINTETEDDSLTLDTESTSSNTEDQDTYEAPDREEEQRDVGSCSSEQVAINSASYDELKEITHIGSERAEEIEELREQQTFSDYESLTSIDGIGDARADEMEDNEEICFS